MLTLGLHFENHRSGHLCNGRAAPFVFKPARPVFIDHRPGLQVIRAELKLVLKKGGFQITKLGIPSSLCHPLTELLNKAFHLVCIIEIKIPGSLDCFENLNLKIQKKKKI